MVIFKLHNLEGCIFRFIFLSIIVRHTLLLKGHEDQMFEGQFGWASVKYISIVYLLSRRECLLLQSPWEGS